MPTPAAVDQELLPDLNIAKMEVQMELALEEHIQN
jgi:hypothetical protein